MANLKLDIEQFQKQLELLGYTKNDKIYLADFAGKPQNFFQVPPMRWEISWNEINKLKQHPKKGLYIVVNGQGQTDNVQVQAYNIKDKKEIKVDLVDGLGNTIPLVKFGRAIFIEHDNLPIEDQKILWQTYKLPKPTFQVQTRKSVHNYWVFDKPIDIELWKPLQEDLIAFTNADKSNKNPSRVMRVAGSWHIAKDDKGNDLEPLMCQLIQGEV